MTNEAVYYRCPDCNAPMKDETHRSINQHSGALVHSTLIVCTKCGQKRDVNWDKVIQRTVKVQTNGKTE